MLALVYDDDDLVDSAGRPHRPDFNPIEKMWSKVKESLRDAKA